MLEFAIIAYAASVFVAIGFFAEELDEGAMFAGLMWPAFALFLFGLWLWAVVDVDL